MDLDFIAEIKQTKQHKSSSLDNIYELTLRTDNSSIMDLGKISPDQLVRVHINDEKT